MKTKLPASINSAAEAKKFLAALEKNGESFHPEDPAQDIVNNNGRLFMADSVISFVMDGANGAGMPSYRCVYTDFNKDVQPRTESIGEKIIILFTCNAWHEYASMSIEGVFSSKQKAIAYAKHHATKSEEGVLDSDDVYNLEHINQTQNRSENYHMEERECNPKAQ